MYDLGKNYKRRKNNTPFKILSIAGHDSGGGAGLQADLKVFHAFGLHGLSVVTAVTAQNTRGVQEILPLPATIIKAQLESVLQDMGADCVKIGMLGRAEAVEAVVEVLSQEKYRGIPIILDPVLKASRGGDLLDEQGQKILLEKLWPMATVATPNLPEAQILAQLSSLWTEGQQEEEKGDVVFEKQRIEAVAFHLQNLGAKAVVVKGGHGPHQECWDALFYRDELGRPHWNWYGQRRILTRNSHGTGCTYASALSAYLVLGHPLLEAVALAQHYVQRCLLAAMDFELGGGPGPLWHVSPWDLPGEQFPKAGPPPS